MELAAKYLNIPLTRVEKEQQHAVVKAELIPPSAVAEKKIRTRNNTNHSTAVCSVQ